MIKDIMLMITTFLALTGALEIDPTHMEWMPQLTLDIDEKLCSNFEALLFIFNSTIKG